jgi:hypothetical protein
MYVDIVSENLIELRKNRHVSNLKFDYFWKESVYVHYQQI